MNAALRARPGRKAYSPGNGGQTLKVKKVPAPRRMLFTKREGDQIVSLVEMIILPDVQGRRPAAYIHKVETDEEFRGGGHASVLVKEALGAAERMDCYKVFLVCDPGVAGFYSRLGLRQHQISMAVRYA